MPDWPFVSYPTDVAPDSSSNLAPLYPQFRGETCASRRPDPTPRGLNIRFAGPTFVLGGKIFQGVPREMSVYGGPIGFGASRGVSVGPNLAGTGANGADGPGNTVWTNPSNVTSTSSYATLQLATAGANGASAYVHAANFLFSIAPPNVQIVGVNVIGNAFADATADFVGLQLQLLQNGAPVGTPKLISISSSAAAFSVGANGDLWNIPGSSLLASDVNQSTFGVAVAAVYQGSHSSGNHTWQVNNINLTLFTADPGTNPWLGSGNAYTGTFSLPLSTGGMAIANYSANSIGIVESITDVRPSGLSAMPIFNGFQEQVTDDVTKLRTLDNSFHVRCDHLQTVGRVYVGPGQIKLPNNSIVTWNGAGAPNNFYFGPFVRAGQIAGKQAVVGRPGVADCVVGIVQIYMDDSGTITWNDAPVYPTPVTSFPSNVFPLAVVYIDSASRVNDIVDCRPAS